MIDRMIAIAAMANANGFHQQTTSRSGLVIPILARCICIKQFTYVLCGIYMGCRRGHRRRVVLAIGDGMGMFLHRGNGENGV